MAPSKQNRFNAVRSAITKTSQTDRSLPIGTLASIPNLIRAGGKSQLFTLIYRDNHRLDRSSLSGRDILVTGPKGFKQFATLSSVSYRHQDKVAIATYRINALGGTWDHTDNGVYRIALTGTVNDSSKNLVRKGSLGYFRVAIQVPTVKVFQPPAIAQNSNTADFQITYTDPIALNVSTLDSRDILVTSANGFRQFATLVSVSTAGGTSRTATYRIKTSSNSWNQSDNGLYTLALQANQVKNSIGNAAAARTIGSFQINLPDPALNYGEALQKSFLFYEAQRSGNLPSSNRIEWRGDSGLTDGADVGVDLTGSYYDAGDHVKFGLPMTSSMTLLSWGVIEYRNAYQKSGQLDEVLDAIRWGTDYILKAHIANEEGTQQFWGQVGNGKLDHDYWGKPEAMTMPRPAYKIDRQNPGSDLAGEAAAALAAAAIVFRSTDPAYADRLLKNAVQLFKFADTYRGKYSDSISDAKEFYESNGFIDELTWSAAWLYKATGNRSYLSQAESYYKGIGPEWTHDWNTKSYGAAILLAQVTGDDQYKREIGAWLDDWADEGGSVPHTQGGLALLSKWGSLRYSANTAFLAGIYSDRVSDEGDRYSNFAESQIDYILGVNPNNISYLVGFGEEYPQNPHHRGASGTSAVDDLASNRYILYGALVGGPSNLDDTGYVDSRTDYRTNEVALDYNAALTGALARMYSNFGGNPLSDAQLNTLPGITVNPGIL
jgi:endoglucanase